MIANMKAKVLRMVELIKEIRLLLHAIRRLLEIMIKLSNDKKEREFPPNKTSSQPYYK